MLSVGADPVVVETELVTRGLACPDCGEWLAPWGWVWRRRFVRVRAEGWTRVRLRRAICSGGAGCGRSHVLLPRGLLGRRVDPVAVIWEALLARAAGLGWRKITELVGRPSWTVRGWLSRFAEVAEPIRVWFAQLERRAGGGDEMDRLGPAGSPTADAVAQIGAACAAVRRGWGPAVFTVSAAEMVAACSGGWLLRAGFLSGGALRINTSAHL